jgi:lipopolysaccharide transport system ATP-binding protein
VGKTYPMYHHFTGGIKNFLFNLPEALRSLRSSRFEALREVSFEVAKGETLGIVGGNGAGKSTLLGLAAGVLRPTTGKVKVSGRISPLLELGAGFHRDLTGLENIMLNGVLLGLTRAEVKERLAAIVEFSELGAFIDQPLRVYSNGMVARLGFSVAAHLDPDVMLIDEVLAVGDEEFQKKCLEKMREFKRKGVTMLFVSHSMPSVKLICDRVIWIADRRVNMAGAPAEVVRAYAGEGAGL